MWKFSIFTAWVNIFWNRIAQIVHKIGRIAFLRFDWLLFFSGPNLTEEPETQEQSQGVDAIKEIVEKASGSSYTFHDALNNLKFFAPKKTQARGQPFNFEIGQDVFIPMQMYVKNSEFSTKMSFETVSKQTNENVWIRDAQEAS